MNPEQRFETKRLPQDYDYLAPDGSEIRLLTQVQGGGLCHCALPEAGVSEPVYHKTVEELWYCISGQGEVWRKQGFREEITPVYSGVSLSIPVGTAFQFRNTGVEPLCFLIATMPPWPGKEEAITAQGKWS